MHHSYHALLCPSNAGRQYDRRQLLPNEALPLDLSLHVLDRASESNLVSLGNIF